MPFIGIHHGTDSDNIDVVTDFYLLGIIYLVN